MLRRAYNGLERTFGPTHGITLNYRHDLVLTLAVQDKDVEAEAEAREIVKITDKSLGAERQNWPRDLLGAVLDKQGKHKEAEVQIRQALRLNEKANGADHHRLWPVAPFWREIFGTKEEMLKPKPCSGS